MVTKNLSSNYEGKTLINQQEKAIKKKITDIDLSFAFRILLHVNQCKKLPLRRLS